MLETTLCEARLVVSESELPLPKHVCWELRFIVGTTVREDWIVLTL
jgi:hypothetical protein